MLSERKKFKRVSNARIIMKPKCPECGSLKINRGLGEIVCKKCGFVLEDNIIVGS
jgi:ribosomal protein L37AE/L43A